MCPLLEFGRHLGDSRSVTSGQEVIRAGAATFQGSNSSAKPAMKAYTRRKRKETFDWINELTRKLIRAWSVHTQREAETARRLAVETWLQRNGAITVVRNKKVLPVFLPQFAHN
jgi:hypothetical protein